jgi:fumarate hydratase class II
MRREFDSMGDVGVPANRYWGAQTQRSLQHFNIGHDRMPKEVYHAYGYVKKAAALVNTRAGRLPDWKGRLIQQVSSSSLRSMRPSPAAIRSFSATASRSASAARAVSAGLIGADDCSVPVI